MDLQKILSLEKLVVWFFSSGIKVLVILAATWVIVRFVKIFLSRFLRKAIRRGTNLGKRHPTKVEEDRTKTVVKVVTSIARAIIWLIALITVSSEFGIDIGPLLAGLGVMGLALSLGARSLIQDYLSGIFILVEDHYRVGEKVNVAGAEGVVVDFNLRRTAVKGEDNVLHYIPNSQIKKASNFSRKKK